MGYEPNELPDCSTPRHVRFKKSPFLTLRRVLLSTGFLLLVLPLPTNLIYRHIPLDSPDGEGIQTDGIHGVPDLLPGPLADRIWLPFAAPISRAARFTAAPKTVYSFFR